jgi:hypothetical protein
MIPIRDVPLRALRIETLKAARLLDQENVENSSVHRRKHG